MAKEKKQKVAKEVQNSGDNEKALLPQTESKNSPAKIVWIQGVHISKRPLDWVLIVYFLSSFLSTYFFAIQQATGINFDFPTGVIYPPPVFIDWMIWWGTEFHPLCLINPLFYRTIQAVNVTLFGPFFLFAVFTFIRGLNWIRTPALIWSICSLYSLLLTITEEVLGLYATPSPVLAAYYGVHVLCALLTAFRVYKPFPFGAYLRLVYQSPTASPTNVNQ